MDWALDHSPLSLCDVDLRKVFRYEPGNATVIRLNASSTVSWSFYGQSLLLTLCFRQGATGLGTQ